MEKGNFKFTTDHLKLIDQVYGTWIVKKGFDFDYDMVVYFDEKNRNRLRFYTLCVCLKRMQIHLPNEMLMHIFDSMDHQFHFEPIRVRVGLELQNGVERIWDPKLTEEEKRFLK